MLTFKNANRQLIGTTAGLGGPLEAKAGRSHLSSKLAWSVDSVPGQSEPHSRERLSQTNKQIKQKYRFLKRRSSPCERKREDVDGDGVQEWSWEGM